MTGLDRGVLVRVDRRLLSGLGGNEALQVVRVPTTPAKWATWKRYCESAGVSMGRVIATLIDHELAGVLDDIDWEDTPVLTPRTSEELARRKAQLTRSEEELRLVEDRLSARDEHLRGRERDLEARQRRVSAPAKSPILPGGSRGRVGRNELCPCGSGRKYKHCHSLIGPQA